MYRAQRNGKSPSSGERIDFKFSNFQALQVPKVWDKLLVSIISVETGKTVARSNKALVRNGNCQWTESLSESIWISHDDSSKDMEEHLFKFVVSMGSARSGILGEASVNIARYYTSSRSSAPISLPLKKCNHGTVLQLKIQCLTPRTKLRVEGLREEARDESYDDALSRSNGSAASGDLSAKSTPSQDLPPTSLLRKMKIMETSYEPSGSNQNNDSAEYSLEKERFYRNSHINGIKNRINNTSSRNSSPRSNYPNEEDLSISKSNTSSFKSRITHDDDQEEEEEEEEEEYEETTPPVIPTSSMQTNPGSSKNLLEAAEDTIEELREEAKMWERNSQKLMLDLEILKERFSDQSKNLENSKMELSAARAERDGMKKEVDQLKRLLEVKQKVKVESTYNSESGSHLLKELEIELKAHKESNTDLSQQLKRNQESNIELVCILQELEETTETQRAEIEELLVVKSKFIDLEKSFNGNLVEIRSLQLNLQQMEESEKTLQANLQILEQALENKISDLENERNSNSRTLSLLEKEYKNNLSIKEEEINNLESKLSERNEIESQQVLELQSLEEKVKDVEKECGELSNENLEILGEVKELKKVIQERNSVIEENQKVIEDYGLKIRELKSLNEKQEAQIYDLENENEELQENMEAALEESNITSKCLDNLRNDLMVLSSSVDSQVSANKLLEQKAFDLEKVKHETELRLFEVEEENVQLSESLTTLESQLKRVKDEHETIQLELKKSESLNLDLQNEVEKLYNIERLLLDSQKECEILKSEKKKLLESSETLVEESRSLEKLYEEVRKEKGELHEKCATLEVELTEARGNLVISAESVASLEEKYSSMLEEYMFKEKSLSSHLDELNQENWQLKEKVTMEESLLNQMYLEKTSEIESFQKQVQHLQDEITRLHEQKSKVASEKSKLESSLKEVHSRKESIENEFQTFRKESELIIQELKTEITSIKESNKKLITDHEKKSRVLYGYRTREERRKTMENDLELKLTVSEYERQQLIQETSKLKDRLQKTSNLENEVIDHKRKLDKLQSEKNNLEASFRSLSTSFEEIKEEKTALVKEYEDCKRERNVLEEKVVDLTTKGASRSLDGEMKNELSRIKSANLQYQLKIQQIESEKNECLKKVHALEEDLMLLSTKSGSKTSAHETHSHEDIDNSEKIEMLEAQLDEALDANNKYRAQLKKLKSEGRNSISSTSGKPKAEGDVITKERFERTKSSLETELKDLRDRYLEMSLKYAEVEAEREDLVMQLKTNTSTRRRFQFRENP